MDYSTPDSYDELVMFDTKSLYLYEVKDVLEASCNAPIYFMTPVKIGDSLYIDGGMGGNCPLAEAMERLKQIFPGSKLNSALSIAPPPKPKSKKLILEKFLHTFLKFFNLLIISEPIPTSKQLKYYLSYFPKQMTSGYSIYMETKKQFKEATFQRREPRANQCKVFKMDELNVDAMIEAVKKER